MTWPAAPSPVWPLTSTTRVEATFSERRSRVVNNSTVGKAEKSSGLAAFSATMITARLIMMLVMNPTSSMKAGIGTIMNRTSIRMPSGRIAPRAVWPQILPLTSVRVMSCDYLPRVASMR